MQVIRIPGNGFLCILSPRLGIGFGGGIILGGNLKMTSEPTFGDDTSSTDADDDIDLGDTF